MYTMYLDNKIENRQASLTAFQDELRQPIVQEIKTVAARLDSANNRLTNHMAVSQVFDALNSITLRNVRWRTLRFEFQNNAILLTLDGEAKTFASVALQADQFTGAPLFLKPIISNLNTSNEAGGGAVRFAFRANIDPSLLSYDALIKLKTTPVTDTEFDTSTQDDGVVSDGSDGSAGATVGGNLPSVQVQSGSAQ